MATNESRLNWGGANPQIVVRGGRIRVRDANSGEMLDLEMEERLLVLVFSCEKDRRTFLEKHRPRSR